MPMSKENRFISEISFEKKIYAMFDVCIVPLFWFQSETQFQNQIDNCLTQSEDISFVRTSFFANS